VLAALAERYEQTRAGRTGQAARDLSIDYEELLRIADCATGDDRVCAERDLSDAESKNLLKVERHRRGRIPLRVRFSATNESLLFEMRKGSKFSTISAHAFRSRFVPFRWTSALTPKVRC
jgi:hypothetical protein